MPNNFIRRVAGLVVCTMAMILVLPGAYAQVLESSVQTETGINQAASTSQKRVTRLAQQTADLLAEYRSVVRETESLKIYNDNLEKVVMDQREEVVSINQQLNGLEATNRGIVPLMLEMIDTLDKIVEGDMPFRLEERRARVVRLRNMMDQAIFFRGGHIGLVHHIAQTQHPRAAFLQPERHVVFNNLVQGINHFQHQGHDAAVGRFQAT